MDINLVPVGNKALEDLYKDIFNKCSAKSTGTFFVASDDNRSGQVVIHRGSLVGVSYAGETNTGALKTLASLKSLRHSFTPEFIFPVPETLMPDTADSILDALGFPEYQEQTAGVDAASNQAEVDMLMPQEHEPAAASDESTPTTKSKRIYRGRVVN